MIRFLAYVFAGFSLGCSIFGEPLAAVMAAFAYFCADAWADEVDERSRPRG